MPTPNNFTAVAKTQVEALTELSEVFNMIELENRAIGQPMPRDTTEIVHA